MFIDAFKNDNCSEYWSEVWRPEMNDDDLKHTSVKFWKKERENERERKKVRKKTESKIIDIMTLERKKERLSV